MDDQGKQHNVWENGEIVTAVAYDAPIPGYGTKTTNNLRLWSSKLEALSKFSGAKSPSYSTLVCFVAYRMVEILANPSIYLSRQSLSRRV